MASKQPAAQHTAHTKQYKWLYNGKVVCTHELQQRKHKSKPLNTLSAAAATPLAKPAKPLKRLHTDSKPGDKPGKQHKVKYSPRKPKPATADAAPQPLLYTYNTAQYAVPNTYYTSVQLPYRIVENSAASHNDVFLRYSTHSTDDWIDLSMRIRSSGRVLLEIHIYSLAEQPHSELYNSSTAHASHTANSMHNKHITHVSDRAGILIDSLLYNHSINRVAAYNQQKHERRIERDSQLDPAKYAARERRQYVLELETATPKQYDTTTLLHKQPDPMYKQKLLQLQEIINEQQRTRVYPTMHNRAAATPSKLAAIHALNTAMSEAAPAASPVTPPSTQPVLLRNQSSTPNSATSVTVDTEMRTSPDKSPDKSPAPPPAVPTAAQTAQSNGADNTEAIAPVKPEAAAEPKPAYTAEQLDMIKRATRIKQAMKLAGMEQSTQIQQYLQQQQQQLAQPKPQPKPQPAASAVDTAVAKLITMEQVTDQTIIDAIDTDALVAEHDLGLPPPADISEYRMPHRCAYHDRKKERCPVACNDRWREAQRDKPSADILEALNYREKVRQLRRTAINQVKNELKRYVMQQERKRLQSAAPADSDGDDSNNVLTITDNGLTTTNKRDQRMYEMKLLLGDLESTLSPW